MVVPVVVVRSLADDGSTVLVKALTEVAWTSGVATPSAVGAARAANRADRTAWLRVASDGSWTTTPRRQGWPAWRMQAWLPEWSSETRARAASTWWAAWLGSAPWSRVLAMALSAGRASTWSLPAAARSNHWVRGWSESAGARVVTGARRSVAATTTWAPLSMTWLSESGDTSGSATAAVWSTVVPSCDRAWAPATSCWSYPVARPWATQAPLSTFT